VWILSWVKETILVAVVTWAILAHEGKVRDVPQAYYVDRVPRLLMEMQRADRRAYTHRHSTRNKATPHPQAWNILGLLDWH
jgi:hypothetical protein